MKVCCQNNRNCSLPVDSEIYTDDPTAILDLNIGQEYLVYAIASHKQVIMYYLCGSLYTFYPRWYPASLFSVSDTQISRYWQCSVSVASQHHSAEIIIGFSEWVLDPIAYYWNLTEHVPEAVAIWKKYKALIENESFEGRQDSVVRRGT
jgi:hypothetical protein